jgi:hypothetical protein
MRFGAGPETRIEQRRAPRPREIGDQNRPLATGLRAEFRQDGLLLLEDLGSVNLEPSQMRRQGDPEGAGVEQHGLVEPLSVGAEAGIEEPRPGLEGIRFPRRIRLLTPRAPRDRSAPRGRPHRGL